MINIISQSYCRRTTSGPKKVVSNLIKGLEKIGYPYVVNKRLDACQRLWIHDDVEALRHVPNLPREIKVVAGPNLVVLPRYLPSGLDLSRVVYLQPSSWAANFWKHFGGDLSYPVEVWPAGIDTNEYRPGNLPKPYVMVYFKQRYSEELNQVLQLLSARKIASKVLIYGSYTESKYKEVLQGARYGIWLGRHETQGIALEEALSAGVPMLVWDVKTVGHWQASQALKKVFTQEELKFGPVTAAEYFDARCGIKIYQSNELSSALSVMESRHGEFHPRDYILEQLSLERQVREFLKIYETHFGLSVEDGRKEQLLVEGEWLNNMLPRRIKIALKDVARIILNRRF